jgi:hypothetical protein
MGERNEFVSLPRTVKGIDTVSIAAMLLWVFQ